MEDRGPQSQIINSTAGGWASWEWTEYPYSEAYVVDFNVSFGWRCWMAGTKESVYIPATWQVISMGDS